jgi:hypothetical protein
MMNTPARTVASLAYAAHADSSDPASWRRAIMTRNFRFDGNLDTTIAASGEDHTRILSPDAVMKQS